MKTDEIFFRTNSKTAFIADGDKPVSKLYNCTPATVARITSLTFMDKIKTNLVHTIIDPCICISREVKIE